MILFSFASSKSISVSFLCYYVLDGRVELLLTRRHI